ncbi:hypothetical protein [Acetobacter senegalensis]|uniref:hypothetical protein n=1 Tax=Acetobacter senegalensis TaxID=446692 RepID=UPI00128B071B|nr:hypothetical protein [Acetobacter senegalensis]MCG4257689.1 hypothetical protein [Acetobacter senegalensis]MCG4267755.1 hypothetical protein [Acetobacter senegalensis]MPQ74795.1 hypothetical protein [Acetobacter senegalensis]
MDKISDIPESGVFYNDGNHVYFIEHFELTHTRAGSVYGLIFMKMTIEQSNLYSMRNRENLYKLARAKYFFRTQKETIEIIGKTTKENFDETVSEYVLNIENQIHAEEYKILTFQSASTIGSGFERSFKNGKDMCDFFNEKKELFK